jgi:hypothetical protein
MSGPWSGDGTSLGEWISHPRATFRRWREPRPLVGAVLLLLGGATIGYVPAQFASELLLIGGAFTVIGLVLAVAVAFCGVAALAKPRFSTVFGTLGIVFSTLSLFGALGGLLVGMVVGTAGGILCYAWEPPEGYETATLAEASGFIWQEAGGFVWQDSRGFVWQTADNRAETGGGDPDDESDSSTDGTGDSDPGLDFVPDATLDADGEGDPGADPTGSGDEGGDGGDGDEGSDGDEDDEIETGFEFDDEMDRRDRFDL